MTHAPGEPLSPEEAERLLAPLGQYRAVILAVSGGPDSMALMHLAAEWHARNQPSCHLLVVTVDHGLRAESAHEAAAVADTAAALGLEHRTQFWEGEKPGSGVPSAARAARYNLLEGIALALSPNGRAAVVTAHTQNDQAETLLMRLMRGSGLEGLAAMAPVRPMRTGSRADLLRPLLDVPKSRLIATLQLRGAAWIEDPTNQNMDFERPRLRQALAALKPHGIEAAALATSARRLREAGEAVDYAQAHFTATLDLPANGEVVYAWCARHAFEAGPPLLRGRVLAMLIARFGGATPAPDLAEVEALIQRLASGGSITATLGGAVVAAGPRWLKVWREVARIEREPLQLLPGIAQLWDNRFWVCSANAEGVSVGALGEEGRLRLGGDLDPGYRLPAAAVAAQPAFWRGGELLAVPSLAGFLKAGTAFAARSEAASQGFSAVPRLH